tara:strand:+ start:402 stop:659 length:258 start_codon:yes stop_codon:yes gene_type:complete
VKEKERTMRKRKRTFPFDVSHIQKVLGEIGKKVGGMKPPHPTEVLYPDVFLFVGIFGECPLTTFDLGNHNITGFVLPVGAFVVIP